MKKQNLLSMSLPELEAFILSLGLQKYRVSQILKWLYEKAVEDIDDMTNLSKDLRTELKKYTTVGSLELVDERTASDGTRKFLFALDDGLTIESVLIPDDDRLTLCISSQVGCAMGCKFCLTGKGGLKRNLKVNEIVGQVLASQRLAQEKRITNIVFMGMGEPLMNLDEISEALWRLTDLMGFSKRKITLSTVGIVPMFAELQKKIPSVNLAISLNATTDDVRDRIMPVNRKYPLSTLLDACRRYPLDKGRKITFEYVLLKGVNDTPQDARRLVKLLHGIPSKVNLIPFNEYDGAEFKAPDEKSLVKFKDILTDSGITAIIRKSKGREILAACGQLGAQKKAP